MNVRDSHATALRRLLVNGDETLMVPVGALPVHAQMAEAAGYGVFQLSNALLARFYGLPHAGLLSQTEVIEMARSMVPLVDIPLYCDAATGFGSAMNVRRTAEEFIMAGIAGFHLGDHAGSGYARPGDEVELLSDAEVLGRLRAAVDVRDELDPDVVVAGRTDAFRSAGGGLDEAVRRSNSYLHDAGVDLVHVDGVSDWETAAQLLAAIDGPAAIDVVCGSPATPPRAGLGEIGQRIQPLHFTLPGIQEVWDLLLRTRDAGESAPIDAYREHLFSLRSTERFVGYGDRFARPSYAEAREWEEKYLPEWMRPAYESATAYTG